MIDVLARIIFSSKLDGALASFHVLLFCLFSFVFCLLLSLSCTFPQFLCNWHIYFLFIYHFFPFGMENVVPSFYFLLLSPSLFFLVNIIRILFFLQNGQFVYFPLKLKSFLHVFWSYFSREKHILIISHGNKILAIFLGVVISGNTFYFQLYSTVANIALLIPLEK